jgi:hypothetical protein
MIDGKSVRQIEFRETDLIQDFERAFNAYLAFLYGSSVEADITAAHQKHAEATSVTPVTTPGDHIAALLHEIRTVAGSGEPMPSHNSAD